MLKVGKLYRTVHEETVVFYGTKTESRLVSGELVMQTPEAVFPMGTLFLVVHSYKESHLNSQWPVYKIIVGDKWYLLQDDEANFRKRYKEQCK